MKKRTYKQETRGDEGHKNSRIHGPSPAQDDFFAPNGAGTSPEAAEAMDEGEEADRNEEVRHVLVNICDDDLRGRKCTRTGCDARHKLCHDFQKGVCPVPTFEHRGLVHLKHTCISLFKGKPCKFGLSCRFGHDYPEERLRMERFRKEAAAERNAESNGRMGPHHTTGPNYERNMAMRAWRALGRREQTGSKVDD